MFQATPLNQSDTRPPRDKIGPGQGRVAGSLNFSEVRGSGGSGQIFTGNHIV